MPIQSTFKIWAEFIKFKLGVYIPPVHIFGFMISTIFQEIITIKLINMRPKIEVADKKIYEKVRIFDNLAQIYFY